MATSSLSLPVELLHDIMVYLDHKSLVSLAQSSRILNAVAIQHLHRTVPRMSGPDTIRCLNTFATTPDIAEKVRTFNIYSSFFQRTPITGPPPAHVQPPRKSVLNRLLAVFSPSSRPLPPVVPPSPHFIAGNERILLQNIADAFYNMKNLHTLIVHAPSHPRIWEFEHPIPTLRTVFVHRNAESPSLFVWIMRQQSITSLRMNFDQKWLQLPNAKMTSSITPPPYLPNLLTLTCNPQGALDLLQGGRVSELIIEELRDITVIGYWATAIASSAESGIKLQRLTVSGVKVAIIRLLERLGHLLPKLLFLRIFAVDYTAERERNFLDQFLPKLNCLEILEIFFEPPSPWHTSPPVKPGRPGVAGEEAKVARWAEACPRLRVVRLQSHSKWRIRRSRETTMVEMEY